MFREDRFARRLLLLAFILNGLHFVLLAALIPRLPASVPLHVDGAGNVLLSGPPSRLLMPAVFGLLTWLTNGALAWAFYERLDRPHVAYVFLGGAVAVQTAAWVSLLLLLP